MTARPASLPTPPQRRLVVGVRSRGDGSVLEVSAETGGLLGHFDPETGQLQVSDPGDSVAVAAALAPYLLAPDEPLGTLSPRHLAAAEELWAILEASAFTWQRYVPVHDRLLLFYCPLVRLTLDIVDGDELEDNVDAPALAPFGLVRANIPLADLEERPTIVAAWLGGVCRQHAGSRPGAKANSAGRRRARVRRGPRL